MSVDLKEFGERFFKIRLRISNSQRGFASPFGASSGTVSEIEQGKRLPTRKFIERAKQAYPKFAQEFDELVRGVDLGEDDQEPSSEAVSVSPKQSKISGGIQVSGSITLEEYRDLVAKAALADAFADAFNKNREDISHTLKRLIDRDDRIITEVREALRGRVGEVKDPEKSPEPEKIPKDHNAPG